MNSTSRSSPPNQPTPLSRSPIVSVVPSVEYRESFLEAIQGYRAANERIYAEMYAPAEVDFGRYLLSLRAQEEGQDLPDGYVPCSHRWLVDADRQVVGVVRIRHCLSWMIELAGGHIGYDVPPRFRRLGHGGLCLAHGLERAREIGLREALVTCSPDNIASRKIILRLGGVFDREVATPKDGPKLRFWIKIGDRAEVANPSTVAS